MKKTLYILKIVALFCGCGQSEEKQTGHKHSFEKIVFHTTECFGFCPTYHLQLDYNKAIKLYAETVYKGYTYEIDTTKTGYFIGVAHDSTFALLEKELETIGLDTLEFDSGKSCCDGSTITIIIYYDGKKKVLKSMFPPFNAEKLVELLHNICEKSQLKRTNQQFGIETEPVEYKRPVAGFSNDL